MPSLARRTVIQAALAAPMLLSGKAMPGAAMAFLIAGEITSLPTAIAVYAIVRKGVFAWYLALGVIGSVLAGFAVDLVSTVVPL